MTRVYATRADLLAYPPPPNVTVPEDPEATRLLTRASERVDDALLTAIYDVDHRGLPRHPQVAEALRLATCAEVVEQLRTGTDDGSDDLTAWGSVSIGSITLSDPKQPGGTPGLTRGLSEDAARHLRRARLGGVIHS